MPVVTCFLKVSAGNIAVVIARSLNQGARLIIQVGKIWYKPLWLKNNKLIKEIHYLCGNNPAVLGQMYFVPVENWECFDYVKNEQFL